MESESLSRRAFLKTLTVGAGAAIAVTSFPTSILAADDPERSAQILGPLPPHYAAGILVERSKDRIILDISDALPPRIEVLLTPETQVCRGSCDEQWHALKKGDRIATATYFGSHGARIARWVNANQIFDWGRVKAINGNIITIEPMSQTYYLVERDLEVAPHTIHHRKRDTIKGSHEGLAIDDYVYYTGTADDPDDEVRHIWAMAISRMGSESEGMDQG